MPPSGRPRKRLETVEELRSFLNISRSSFYELIHQGMPHLRVGSVLRFDRDAVLRWLEARTQEQLDAWAPPRQRQQAG